MGGFFRTEQATEGGGQRVVAAVTLSPKQRTSQGPPSDKIRFLLRWRRSLRSGGLEVGRASYWANPPTSQPTGEETRDTQPPPPHTSQLQSSRTVHTNDLAIRCVVVGGEGCTAAPVERGTFHGIPKPKFPPVAHTSIPLLMLLFLFLTRSRQGCNIWSKHWKTA